MSSPSRSSRYLSNSPVRNLDQQYFTRPLGIILQESNALQLSNSLLLRNQALAEQNQRLARQYNMTRQCQIQSYTQASQLKKERDSLEHNLRSLEARSIAQNQAKEKQLQGQERDIRFLREEYSRQNQALKDQILVLNNRLATVQVAKMQDIQNLRKKYLTVSAQQTDQVRRNLSQELRHMIGQLQLSRQLLGQKQRQLQHLFLVSQQNSQDYTNNLQRLISENNIVRNQLLSLQLQKNKEIQYAQNKKQLQKSRTIGILSYCKENSQYMQKQLTKLAQQLLEKNISIESFTKELLKQRKQTDNNQRKYEETLAKLKQDKDEEIAYRDAQIEKYNKTHKAELEKIIIQKIEIQERLSSKQNQLDNALRELNYIKKQQQLKQTEIDELKEAINNLHDDHSKQLSKVMTESKVKRRSGLNMSSYSSSSLKDIEQAHGSSIMRSRGIVRKQSYSNQGSGLPTVKEQLAVSRGNIDDDDDEELNELILHYEGMIAQLKNNKQNELNLANNKISELKKNLERKDQQLIQILNKFSPLMQLHIDRPNIQEQRRAKIEKTHKADIAILSVLLDKYQIVALKSRNR